MKKAILFIMLLAGSFVLQPSCIHAQATLSETATPSVQLDEKTQKKVDKAKMDLAKDQEKLSKTTMKYEKDKASFEKNKQKGKLSPVDIAKEEKNLANAEKEMAKLKKSISENQALLDKFKI